MRKPIGFMWKVVRDITLEKKVDNLGTYYYLCSQKFEIMIRIIAKRTLKEFWSKHSDSEQYLKTWYDTARNARWKSPGDVRNTFANASIISGNRVVFNIKGNTYRLIVKFQYEKEWAFIRFIGTHSEYDKINAETI